jgi:hypothetical protein
MTVRRWLATLAVFAVAITISMRFFKLGPYDPSRRLGCVIQGDLNCALGTAPRIAVSLINRFDSDIYLVGSLDGSEDQLRYPFCHFEVPDPTGKRVGAPYYGRCGYMNRLREKDFVQVPPGGKFDPYQNIDDHGFFRSTQLWPPTFNSTGTYRVRFVYSTRDGDIRERTRQGPIYRRRAGGDQEGLPPDGRFDSSSLGGSSERVAVRSPRSRAWVASSSGASPSITLLRSTTFKTSRLRVTSSRSQGQASLRVGPLPKSIIG